MRSGGQGFSRHPDVLEVTDEATRRPTSKPFSVSPCARTLRVDRPEARECRDFPLGGKAYNNDQKESCDPCVSANK